MRRAFAIRTIFVCGFVPSLAIALVGCPKKEQAAVEEAGPPPIPDTPDVVVLVPLVEDAGEEAAIEAGKKTWTGAPTNPNQTKIQACCNAMRAQARQLGVSPEAFQISTFAAQCDMFAKQVGPAGTAPEFNQLRQMLKSLKLPAACSF
jgi:hypothetical protein